MYVCKHSARDGCWSEDWSVDLHAAVQKDVGDCPAG